ncbi:shikimate kinase [Synechococcus elongatus]|uniref:Shikimate kinase n=2 Tax=Synechococcus elongatus TaxID=32046 RepID=AROK_SYNE7|nr:shikimate kinase [Synechococcus elongatus]Q31PU5.1 RecName: Full=Shikimate kinase; Short=SK [Synechococcus elongatus PCC 7942 = FACHB-805]Q5N4D3.1 RecName: Full=Shikimate kinase; Short=SK [Synechococcus elongatus PCC 6301]MBD2688893.1 shikimate kinase [Synechococcus elongatus FACHB-1061]ABB56924.1 shikimate kinase [Synechococcus elongatus PCC 7942 = FACHB-805]AJD58548.1 shikimate kinase [Synechococcus elongatus UTEX 2973]MBD2587327.1 shikimate kinase [Synechococcus elongatus FACHB-242]MBD
MSLVTALNGLDLFLVGLMGSGKTTIGKLLAESLGYTYVDTDSLIENVTGRSIPEIFASDGEAGFRQIETQVLEEVASYRRLVVATGGGIVIRPENWSYLQQGLVIWLDVPIPELLRRLEGDQNRPLLQTEAPATTLQALWEQRRDRYAQADLRIAIEASEDPEVTMQRILEVIPSVLKNSADSSPAEIET